MIHTLDEQTRISKLEYLISWMNNFLLVHFADLLELGFLHVVHALFLLVLESHNLVSWQRLTQ